MTEMPPPGAPRHLSFCYGTHHLSMMWCVPCGCVEFHNWKLGAWGLGYMVHACGECQNLVQLTKNTRGEWVRIW